ncbi:MAG: IS5 family transposase [Phocaeicola sp.]
MSHDKLFKELNKQLTSHNLIVNTRIIVDASITDSPRKPKGAKIYEVVEDRQETAQEENLFATSDSNHAELSDSKEEQDDKKEEEAQVSSILVEKPKPGVDTDGRWVKKAGKLRFGYKQHTGTDENGMILSVITTSANKNDMNHLEDVVEKAGISEGAWVMADKGYKSKKNDEIVSKYNWENKVMHKSYRNHPLTEEQNFFNKQISKIRYKIECTFGSMRRWFGAGTARYIGIEKMHVQHLMEAMAYNLYHSPGIAMSVCVK